MKKNKLILISIIYFSCFISLWLIGLLLSLNNQSYIIIAEISSYALAIPIFLSMFSGFGYFAYICIKELFETKKWYHVITAIIIIISIVLFISGIIILFLGAPFENKYEVDKVNVIDVRNNKILVDYSKYSHGEKEIIKINKPFFANIKEGDIIDVRYPINNPEKMHYVVDSHIGEILLGVASVIGTIIITMKILVVIIEFITFTIKK